MQVISIFIAVLAVSRFAIAQSQSGYNYPSPFNQLTPGGPGDLGGAPGSSAQQPASYPGSQPAYNNQQFTPSGPQGPSSSFGATATPGFNQPTFVQPTPSGLPPSIPALGSHSSIPGGHSSVPGSHSSVPGSHSSVPGISAGGFGPSSPSGFPATAVPSPKGFESGFPHSGSHSGGHSGTHSGSLPGAAGTSFQGPSSGFPGSIADSGSAGFGAPSFVGNQAGQSGPGFTGGSQGQPSFGGQGNNFGPSGGSGQFQGENDGSYPGGDYSAIPGTAGVDYPIFTEIPKTSFDCKQQQFPGYYADVEAQCQVFHICALNTTFNFLCPNGTIFSQEHLVCVWWNQFDCNSAPSLYGNNAYIYDYSKTGQSQEGQGPTRNFGNAPDGVNNFDGGAQGPGFGTQGGSPGFGASQPGTGFGQSSLSGPTGSGAGFGPSTLSGSPGFVAQTPSSGFGPSAASAPAFSTPSGSSGFGPSSSGAPAFGSSLSSGAAGYPSASSPASGFGTPPSSHSPGFGHSHIPSSIPSSGSSHTSSHNVPSSHSFPSQSQPGAEQYPIAPPSQTDYQSPVIAPTIPSSPAPFGIAGGPATGYPPAGTPSSPLNPALTGEQPSREYLPQRRTK